MTFGYIWAVGQGGFSTVNKNLCDLWKDTFGPPPSCQFNKGILLLWGLGALAAALFLVFDFARWFRKWRLGKNNTADNIAESAPRISDGVKLPTAVNIVGDQANIQGVIGAEKLFRITDRSEVKLRFFPETGAKKRDDALLLIIYGYKLLLGVKSVNQNTAHFAINELLLAAPNSPLSYIGKMVFQSASLSNNHDYGLEYENCGLLNRTRLSTGGFYSLTPEGETHAKQLMERCILNA